MNFWNRFFKKKNKQDIIKNIKIGDFVFVEFYKPDEIGFVTPKCITYTRFNDFELKECKVHGTVIRKYREPSLNQNILIIGTIIPENQLERKYTFLEQEIKNIRKAK